MLNKCLINIKNFCNDCIFIPSNCYFYNCLWRLYVFYDIKRYINIVLVNEKKISYLNFKYRNKNKSTNILSFSYYLYKYNFYNNNFLSLGDIILSPFFIFKESKYNNYNYFFHFFHILIHGMLHILGFKHDNLLEYKNMKKQEYFFLFMFKNNL